MDYYNMHPRVYDAARLVLRILFWIFLDCEIEGVEHFPQRGPVIVMINHISFLDPLIPVIFAPRRIWLMSKKENFDIPFISLLARFCGVYPIDRYNLDIRAMRRTIKLLNAGNAVLIAPEGTRSQTGELQHGHDGLAWIATRTSATIVPVGLSGCDLFFHNLKRLRRTQVRAVFGEPFKLSASPRRIRGAELTQLTSLAMRRLADTLPSEYRGVYATNAIWENRA